MTPTPTTPLSLPPTPPRNRALTPESPTPQRGGTALAPSPPPLVRSPSPTPVARHPLGDTSPPTDLARQIAAVTEDLAGLRAEEQRLSQRQREQVRSPLHPLADNTAVQLTIFPPPSPVGLARATGHAITLFYAAMADLPAYIARRGRVHPVRAALSLFCVG